MADYFFLSDSACVIVQVLLPPSRNDSGLITIIVQQTRPSSSTFIYLTTWVEELILLNAPVPSPVLLAKFCGSFMFVCCHFHVFTFVLLLLYFVTRTYLIGRLTLTRSSVDSVFRRTLVTVVVLKTRCKYVYILERL